MRHRLAVNYSWRPHFPYKVMVAKYFVITVVVYTNGVKVKPPIMLMLQNVTNPRR